MPSLQPLTITPFAADGQPVLTAPAVGALLRPWRADDAPAVRAVYDDEPVRRWHVRSLGSDDEARATLEGWREGWGLGSGASWAVVDAVSDVLLARVAVKVFDPQGVGEIAYWTAPAARGRGVAPTALDVASAWAFGAGFHRLELQHSTDNAPSCRVALKAGYAAEGVRREAVLHADGWHDMHVHARLASAR
ncbi:GNAT family N-acetyltransferase [Isoptericola sp. NEAU-Y5]|uniref:GNAT family N-acetyltransferase n=1 Tax=Isoptericola luteus TaxID=2879484 RepID=A0ABS7ZHC4_9MICO|nr:GNAT family protein [Isoptericola sp. NEAU-Y5]MCA5894428.1 GNAT family N-acetyltransferase [Isoptericola sp. NEAU-Y5]